MCSFQFPGVADTAGLRIDCTLRTNDIEGWEGQVMERLDRKAGAVNREPL